MIPSEHWKHFRFICRWNAQLKWTMHAMFDVCLCVYVCWIHRKTSSKWTQHTYAGAWIRNKRAKENDHVFTPDLLTQTRKITFMKNNAKDFILEFLTIDFQCWKYQPNAMHSVYQRGVCRGHKRTTRHTFIYRYCIENVCVSTINKLIIIENDWKSLQNEGLFHVLYWS